MPDLMALALRVAHVENHYRSIDNMRNFELTRSHQVLLRLLTGAVNTCNVPMMTRLVVLLETSWVDDKLWTYRDR